MNIKLIKSEMKRLPQLLLGLVVMSTGIYLTKIAYIGLAPWGVLHDGLAVSTGLSFGMITVYLGLVILFFSMLILKTKIGIGTIINILICGNIIDLLESLNSVIPENLIVRIVIFAFGFLLTTFGRSLYIASDLGSGPRDGMFVGISRVTQIDVTYVKPIIEFTVIVLGLILGGNFGVGTFILMIFSGYFVQLFFKILHFDPKKKTQSDITNYILKRNLS